MKKCFAIVIGAALLTAGCGKNSHFPSTPQITLKSISTNVVPANGTLTVTLGFRDAEGDIQDTLFYSKIIAGDTVFRDVRQAMPTNIPKQKNMEGEIIFDMDYTADIGAPQNSRPDTAVFGFYLRDVGGHHSDTVYTSPIVIINS